MRLDAGVDSKGVGICGLAGFHMGPHRLSFGRVCLTAHVALGDCLTGLLGDTEKTRAEGTA